MLPGIYEFRWDAGHVVFLGAFWTVALVILSALCVATVRTWRSLRAGRADRLRWHEDFEALPEADRPCRHACSGKAPGRVCQRAFECAGCPDHDALCGGEVEPAPAFGLPEDRLYDRGHAWARREDDGTWTVGLDPLARRLVPGPDALALPAEGVYLPPRAPAATVNVGGAGARILSPLPGRVIERGPADADWLLRLRPDAPPDVTHLLGAAEASHWLRREVDRLRALVTGGNEAVGPTLCDGGLPDPAAVAALPRAERDALFGRVLLEP